MRTTVLFVVACLACLAWFAVPANVFAAAASDTRAGDAVLARSARAYREAPALYATARYVVNVPGAPLHEESQEFGRGPGVEAWIRMPSAYVMQVHHDRLYLVEEGRLDPHAEASLAAGLQAAIDSAFGGQGPPLAPVPLLLARARTSEARCDAFRMKLLGPLRVATVRSVAGGGAASRDEVDLIAQNGFVRARFDHQRGWLLGATVAFVPGPGADTIHAEVSYVSDSATPPPFLAESRLRGGRRVYGLQALSGESHSVPEALDRGPAFFSREGTRVGLSDLRAKLVVLEFWATWCAPCRVAIPGLVKFARWARDSAAGVSVVLVNTEEAESDPAVLRPRVERYLDKLAVGLPCWIDSGGVVHRTIGGGLPLTLVLNPSGRIVRMYTGLHANLADSLARLVRTHLAAGP